MNKKRLLGLSSPNQRKKNILYSRQYFSETFNNLSNLSSNRLSSQRHKQRDKDKPARLYSSMSSIFSQKSSFKKSPSKNISKNFNILDLMIINNPNKYNYKKLKNKIREINNLYSSRDKESHLIPQSTNRVKELYYNYNVLYGQNTKNLIRTYSPTMRPKSSSINKFVKKMNMDQRESLSIFKEDEIVELIKAKCSDIGIELKEHMLSKFKDYCNTKCKNRIVDLTENYLGIHTIKFLGNILYNFDRISRLNLSKNNLGDIGAEMLVKYIKTSYSLISLNISSNGITYRGGEAIFKNMVYQQSLLDFNISTIEGSNKNRNRLTSNGIKDIILYLKNNSFIEYLNLGGNSLKDEGFILICKGLNENHSLNTLKIPQNEIEEKGIIQGLKFITSSRNKLINLDISKNKIMDEGLIFITDQLKDFPNLYSLNISFCNFEFQGFQYLIKNLQYNRKLEVLNVSGNRLKSKYYDSLKPFFSFLGIKSLNMAKCHLGDLSTFELGYCIEQNCTIKKLNISDNEICDEGFKSFSTLFYKNLVVESFDCSSNFLTDTGVKELIKSLEYNTSIKSINLYDNQLHNETGNLIMEILEKNKILTYLNLLYNRIPMKKIDEINKILKSNSEKQKLKLVPNLIRSVRDLGFNPDQFDLLTTKIKEKKKEQNHLYQKVRDEDKMFSSILDVHLKNIDNKNNYLDNLNNQIKDLENNIHRIDKEIDTNEKNFLDREHKLKETIFDEKSLLNEVLSKHTYAEHDYDTITTESNHVLAMTQEKYNLSIKSLKKAQTSLSLIKNEFLKKNNIYQKLVNESPKYNLKKTKTIINNTNSSKNKSKSSLKSNRNSMIMRGSIFFRKKLTREKDVNDFRKKKIKNKKSLNINYSKKKLIKMKSDSVALLYFSKKNDSSILDEESYD